MLKGEPLAAAIREAMRRKGVGPTEVAREFGIKPPSVHDWMNHGRIGKDKLDHLIRYFSDVANAEHWGLTGGTFTTPEGNMVREAPAHYRLIDSLSDDNQRELYRIAQSLRFSTDAMRKIAEAIEAVASTR